MESKPQQALSLYLTAGSFDCAPPSARARLRAYGGVGPTQRLNCAGPSIHPDEASGHSG